MRRTRHVVLPVRSWQYMGLMMVSLACLTLGLVSRDREGRSGSLAGPELMHTAPHEVDACPNTHPLTRLPPYDDTASLKVLSIEPGNDAGDSVRSRVSRDSRSVINRMSRARSIDRRVEPVRTSRDRQFDVQNRLTNTDRKSRIGMSRVDRFSTSSLSRSNERRENPGSLTREKRIENINRQPIITDRRARMIRAPSVLAADEEKQRLISRSQDRRFTGEFTSSRSQERRSVGTRSDATDLRRTARSVNERDARDVKIVRMSRSDRQSENRDRRTVEKVRSVDDNRRDVRRTNDYSEDRLGRRVTRLSRSRSEDVVREDISRGSRIRSQQRRSSDRQAINPVERQERRTNLLSRSRDVEMSQSRDVHRAVTNNRGGVRSDARRSSESGESNRSGRQERRMDILRTSRDARLSRSRDVSRESARSDERRIPEHRGINAVERQERRTNILARSRDVRHLQARDVDRVDVRRVAERSEERKTSDRRMINPVERHESRVNILSRSRDVRLSRSRDVDRVDVRRIVDQSEERRRTTDQRLINPVERRESRNNIISRSRDVRLSRSRDVNRADVRRVVDQSEERRRTTNQRLTNSVERRENRNSILSRSRDVRLSRSRDVDRSDVRRVVDQSEERRRTTDQRLTNSVERRENRNNILSRSRDVRLSRSRDVDRSDVSRVVDQSEERRRTTDQRLTNSVERRENRNNIRSRSRDVRLSRSRDVDRVDVGRIAERSEERRTNRRLTNPLERRESRINIVSRDVRLSRSRDIDRADVTRIEKRSAERKTSENRKMSPIDRQERRTNVLARSRDVRLAGSRDVQLARSRDIGRLDSRRAAARSQEPSERRDINPLDRLEQRVNILAKSADVRRIQSNINRADIGRSRERLLARRSSERRETSPMERQERRVSLSAPSGDVNRDVRRTEIRLQRSSIEQRNKNGVQLGRRMNNLASRDVGRTERLSGRRSLEREAGRTSWVDSLRRNSENRERLAAFTREHRISRDITIGRTSATISQSRDVRSSRNARITDSEDQERRGRFVERDIRAQRPTSTREHRISEAKGRINVGRKRTTNEIRINRAESNREARNERHQMISANILTSENVGGMLKGQMEYLRQAVILALCAVYSASLFKGKGGFYGFRNILAQTSRLAVW